MVILDETDCVSQGTNTLRKGMNPIILPSAMGKSDFFVQAFKMVRDFWKFSISKLDEADTQDTAGGAETSS